MALSSLLKNILRHSLSCGLYFIGLRSPALWNPAKLDYRWESQGGGINNIHTLQASQSNSRNNWFQCQRSLIGAWKEGLELGENLEELSEGRPRERDNAVSRVQWIVGEGHLKPLKGRLTGKFWAAFTLKGVKGEVECCGSIFFNRRWVVERCLESVGLGGGRRPPWGFADRPSEGGRRHLAAAESTSGWGKGRGEKSSSAWVSLFAWRAIRID